MIQKSEPHLVYDCIFTVFLIFHPNRFCFNSEPRELVWKSVWPIPHRNFVSKFHLFFKIFKNIIWFSDFLDSRPKKIGFGGLGTFLAALLIRIFTDLFTVWKMFQKLSPILCISFSYVCSRQYGISPFLKTILNQSEYL